jgi:hypothetical protein
MLSSSHRTGASHTDSSFGGGSPTYTTTVGGVLGAREPPDTVLATIEDSTSRLPIASFLWFVFTVVSL